MAIFEQLDDQLLVGSKISMTPIERKILTGKNKGYCFSGPPQVETS